MINAISHSLGSQSIVKTHGDQVVGRASLGGDGPLGSVDGPDSERPLLAHGGKTMDILMNLDQSTAEASDAVVHLRIRLPDIASKGVRHRVVHSAAQGSSVGIKLQSVLEGIVDGLDVRSAGWDGEKGILEAFAAIDAYVDVNEGWSAEKSRAVCGVSHGSRHQQGRGARGVNPQ